MTMEFNDAERLKIRQVLGRTPGMTFLPVAPVKDLDHLLSIIEVMQSRFQEQYDRIDRAERLNRELTAERDTIRRIFGTT